MPPPARPRWTVARAEAWSRRTGTLCGVNYLPRTAVNATEMWQEATFEPRTIAQELGWARAIGINAVRVFLPYLVWRADPSGFRARLRRFLAIAEARGIRTMLVLFDDCAFSGREPYLGPQDPPVPGVHNSGWTPSPGPAIADDRAQWPDLERYVKDLLNAFGGDPRVLAWDLYNEPGNEGRGERSRPLLEAAFAWGRAARPTQPLTAGPWVHYTSPLSRRMFALSDVVSFHVYEDAPGTERTLAAVVALGRPAICTEWLHRAQGSIPEATLPLFARVRVGGFSWGLVAGRTQTGMPWNSMPGDPAPAQWQHDLLHGDGSPYNASEIALLRDFRFGAK